LSVLKKTPVLFFAAPLLGALVACAGDAEHGILTQFFAGSRLRDLTALTQVSTVVFEPRRDGTVLDFRVEEVGPERQVGDQGGHLSKDVTVRARVRLPTGETVQKTFVVTMERAAPDRAWLVTAFRD
jgi:hypothetical protein